ncbi:hypothetical protein F5888DRAFT_1889568 [Russula emetica]|nr:hypothetical protein F5888DRAFT_1889568 [Russula emetica]
MSALDAIALGSPVLDPDTKAKSLNFASISVTVETRNLAVFYGDDDDDDGVGGDDGDGGDSDGDGGDGGVLLVAALRRCSNNGGGGGRATAEKNSMAAGARPVLMVAACSQVQVHCGTSRVARGLKPPKCTFKFQASSFVPLLSLPSSLVPSSAHPTTTRSSGSYGELHVDGGECDKMEFSAGPPPPKRRKVLAVPICVVGTSNRGTETVSIASSISSLLSGKSWKT